MRSAPKLPGCNSRVEPPNNTLPGQPHFPPGRKLPIRAPLQGSVPPFGSAVVQCMFIPSALIHTLVGNQGLTGAQPVPPSARLRSGRPLSYHQEDEFDSHPSTSPSSPRSDISPSPIGIIPCTPKTSKPRTKSLSDQFSHCGPGAECLALPGLSWRYAEFQPEAKPRVGALRRALLYRGGW